MSLERTRIFFILGPTGVGKTGIALKLAKALNTDIISCDSRQVYIDMNIGTAKPNKAQLAEIKHHLINIVKPSEKYTVYDYVQDARLAIESLKKKNKIPLIVGGTALYAKLLVEGIFNMPPVPGSIKEKVRDMDNEEVLQEIKRWDPPTFKSVSHTDFIRLRRALIVYYTMGKTIHDMRKNSQKSEYEPVYYIFTRTRSDLYHIIDNRVSRMLSLGLMDEVKYIIDKYFGSIKEVFRGESRALNSIGYEEMLRYLVGEFDFDYTVELIKRNSRRFAKRQISFFNQFKNANWFDIEKTGELEVFQYLKKDIFDRYISSYK